jgi:hypothetical protein
LKHNGTLEAIDFKIVAGINLISSDCLIHCILEEEWIHDCFCVNTTLEQCESGGDLLHWYTTGNRVCNSLRLPIQYRNSIPRDLREESQIASFVSQLNSRSEVWRAMKLVTLGHGRIGKTTLLNKLRSIVDPNEKFDVSKATFWY